MSKFIRGVVLSTAISLSVIGTGPAVAQVPPLDLTPITLACTGPAATPDGCTAAIDAFIAGLVALGLTPAEIDTALAEVATTLAEAALAPGSSPAILAAALLQVAAAVTDPAQATAIVDVATAVATGADIPVGAILPAPEASPA